MQRQTATINTTGTVSEIVRDNYRTADVFKHYGINYCCGGHATLHEACTQKGIKINEVEQALQKASTITPLSNKIQFDKWKPDFLIDYLVNIHHAYLQQTLPLLDATFTTFAESHQKKFVELAAILPVFKKLVHLLQQQNAKEETTIFPYLKQLINAYNRKETYGSLFVKTMRLPLNQILQIEQQQISELIIELRKLTNHYTLPARACTNYGVMMHKLAELDADLVQHKHLENNILFPQVLEMEKDLLQL